MSSPTTAVVSPASDWVVYLHVCLCVCVRPDPERAKEIPDPSQELIWSYRGSAGQQGPVQCLSGRFTRPSSRWRPAEPPSTDSYLPAGHRCLPGAHSTVSFKHAKWLQLLLCICSVLTFLLFCILQVPKAAPAISTKPAPAITSTTAAAANQSVSVTGGCSGFYSLRTHNTFIISVFIVVTVTWNQRRLPLPQWFTTCHVMFVVVLF